MTVNWGIIGCGKIASKFASDLQLVKDNKLFAVASRSEDKATAFATQHQALKAYGTYKELCEDKNIDIIYVATPHTSHMKYGNMVMEHGKHLLCEKPVAMNTIQLQSMINTAKKHNVFMMEAMWSRFNPSIIEVLKRAKRGDIGEINYINAEFYFYQDFDPNSRIYDPKLGGGALLDIGIYPLFLSYLLLGMPKEILSKSILHHNGIDLQTSVILSYPRAQSILSCGLNNTAKMIGRVHGTNGSFYLDDRWHETQGFTSIIDDDSKYEKHLTLGLGYSHEILECSRNIKAGKLQSDLWSHDDSLNLMKLCDTVRKQNGITYPEE